MRTLILLLALGLAAAAPTATFADSATVASAFAAATPTRTVWSATFVNKVGTTRRYYSYVFTANRSNQIVALSVNGIPVTIPEDSPLPALPYPVAGTVEEFSVSVQAYDDLSPAQPTASTSGTVSLTVDGDEVDAAPSTVTSVSLPAPADETQSADLVSFKVTADSSDVTLTTTQVVGATSSSSARAAGTGYAYYETLGKGDTVEVWFTPADLVRFLAVPEIGTTGTAGWSLWVNGGSASGPVYVDGQWGFWVFLDPTNYWSYSYWLRGPGVDDWGTIDPRGEDPAVASGVALGLINASGVGIIDLRDIWPQWAAHEGSIDGELRFGDSGYGDTYTGDAVALRCWENQGLNLFYSGPAAYLVVRELDENGAQTYEQDGSPREWPITPTNVWDSETSLSAYVPIVTGRAVLLVYPSKESSRWQRYRVLADGTNTYYGKG